MALPGAGVDLSKFETADPIEPFGRPHILFCGDLITRKNPVLAVEAVDEAYRRGLDVPLVVIGAGHLAEEVRSAAGRLIADHRFLHIERTENVHGYMRGAGLHLMPGLQEGVPRVVIEAMAAGVPTRNQQ